jgi:pullulanase/glycogen debranching enzyme
MRGADWDASPGALGMLLTAPKGPALLALFNRAPASAAFRLPPGSWRQVCDTAAQTPFAEQPRDSTCPVAGRSVVMLVGEERGK